MANKVTQIAGVQGAIMINRNMKDTIRTQFAQKHGPGAFLEAPLSAYYGRYFNINNIERCQSLKYFWRVSSFLIFDKMLYLIQNFKLNIIYAKKTVHSAMYYLLSMSIFPACC